MRFLQAILLFVFMMTFVFMNCQKSPQQNFKQFNREFFAKYVPEFPDAQLMTKNDISPQQQQFFDEAGGRLQLLFDINKDDVPEYIICGFSNAFLQQGERTPYFLAIFEQTKSGIKRLYFQKLLVAPVTLDLSKNKERNGIIVSFAFYSDYAAEIYYENNEFHLEKLF